MNCVCIKIFLYRRLEFQYQNMRDWELVRKEQINAARLVRQLEQLLYEMDTLRAQVQDDDIVKFDKLTANARASTISAIKEYLGNEKIFLFFICNLYIF